LRRRLVAGVSVLVRVCKTLFGLIGAGRSAARRIRAILGEMASVTTSAVSIAVKPTSPPVALIDAVSATVVAVVMETSVTASVAPFAPASVEPSAFD